MTVRRNKSIMVFILVVALFCGMVMFSPRVSAASSETASDTETLQDAFNLVDDGGTITITSDITLNAVIDTLTDNDFTLDLNGYTITVTGYSIINENSGTITIKDTSKGGNGIILSENANASPIVNKVGGSIIVESGTISSESVNTILNSSTGSITVNGGTVKAKVVVSKLLEPAGFISAIRNVSSGSVTVSGGNVEVEVTEQETGIEQLLHINAIANVSTGSVTVSGGTIEAKADYGIAIFNYGKGSIMVSGGLIDASGNNGIGIELSYGIIGELYMNCGSSTVKGKSQAIMRNSSNVSIAVAVDCVAYEDYAMTIKQTYKPDNFANYKVIVFSQKKIPVSTSGLNFTVNSATSDGTIIIFNDFPYITASDVYGGLDASGLQPDIGSVEVPGTDGSVADGSIVITLNKDYLNTLKVGTYKIVVNLKGLFIGAQVSVNITVKKASNTPNTGDNQTIVVWASILILTACVGAVVIKKKKSSVN